MLYKALIWITCSHNIATLYFITVWYIITHVIICAAIIDLVILCYNSNTCALAGEFANAMTIEECCSNNPDGLAFRKFDETCEPCIGMCYITTYRLSLVQAMLSIIIVIW